MHHTAEPLQQVDRVFVRARGRRLLYFAGCDYHRLASHPRVLAAARAALAANGLNVAASRKTTGNHALYEKLERALARFLGAERAVLLGNGYLTNIAVAQALAGGFTIALIDERAHVSLQDAAIFLQCPVLRFRHRDVISFHQVLGACGPGAKPIVLTDGLFSHDGSHAPLAEYLRALPDSGAMLVDDAHGVGVLGRRGRGTAEDCGVQDARVIQTVTLSKALGTYGGAVAGGGDVVESIIRRSAVFVGNTPMPLPLAAASIESLRVFRADRALLPRLRANIEFIQAVLRGAGWELPEARGPILPVIPTSAPARDRLRRNLLAAGIHPPFIQYPGGPREGCFRFVISSQHTGGQLERLAEVLVKWRWDQAAERRS